MNKPLLSVQHLSVFFRQGDTSKQVLNDISFDIQKGQTLALVGESGSGKSVTALAIMGLLPPDLAVIEQHSVINWYDHNLLHLNRQQHRRLRGKEIGMIFQDPMSSLNPVMTVGEQLVEGITLHLSMGYREARARALELLSEVGIPEPNRRFDAYPHELSGGQQQRVMIAIAICGEPQLLIADEPTTALDVTIQRQILELIKRLTRERHMAVLFITHDLALVGEFADQVVVMRHGSVRELGSTHSIFKEAHDPYTRALLLCRPSLEHRPLHLPVVEELLNHPEQMMEHPQDRERGINALDQVLMNVKKVSKRFPLSQGLFSRTYFDAVKEVSCTIYRGKTLGIVGESGSGKTTLGLMLAGIIPMTQGHIDYHQDLQSVIGTAQLIQIIFQNPYASLNPRFTIFQILEEPLILHFPNMNRQQRRAEVECLVGLVGLSPAMLARYPHEFSGGQRQRIAIARCLALKPHILVCDESVSALDVSVQAQVLNLLQDLQDQLQISLIFISHDLSVVRYMSDEIMVMHQGQVVEIGQSDQLIQSPQMPYTQNLISAIPKGYLL
ncbi:MAG: ABC transporter ATP-binding protein [Betaproteobacteria bacterium]|nr:ABC transporter ATP-binding protein [Betaproteobacteria bacterium]MDE2056563.1 ABC transporter ATP-binding protein [Betaproteobacteria bacterium]